MSSPKIMTLTEIRMELARRKMTRVQLASLMNVSPDYVCKIINGTRSAEMRRVQITALLKEKSTNIRGIS